MKNRNEYLNKLVNWKDQRVIKVITGVRRCGKSSLLMLFKDYLEKSSINADQIIFMNFESMKYVDILDYKALYKTISEKIMDNEKKTYILLDEIQLVEGWERCINGLMVDYNVDLYLTGSNSYMLSSELATLLSGRYVEIKMLPLSFKEFLEFSEIKMDDRQNLLIERFEKFFRYGGLPSVTLFDDDESLTNELLSGIYNTVVMKDIIQKNNVRDPALLDSLIRFLAVNVGSIVSTKKISDYLTSAGRKTTPETIDNYLRMTESSFIIYKVNRYDLKGKMHLKTLEKYYLVDTGLRYLLAGTKYLDEGHVLENIVYLELIRREYDVSIGKIGDLEVDFIASKPSEKIYVQVSMTMSDDKTLMRELKPLQALDDNYPKYIITKDNNTFGDVDGIKVINIIDFLLEDY